ncbi:hypothetical protein ABZ646_07935 [Streptomyces sp. NPDC007162]|uniref:hypothetical protein n=1 Tax=Streptomyces sp. NPDC007162 TaxID=3156917 RepID=UPI0033C2AE13
MTAPTPAGLPRTVLRLHRPALLIWILFVAGMCGWLVWLTEVTAKERGPQGLPCLGACGQSTVLIGFATELEWACTLIGYCFVGVAAFAGGALIGRELESGTAQLAWTQGVTPVRWLAAKLALPAAALTVGGTVLVLVFRWASSAHRTQDWTSASVFAARGPLVVAYALCALAVGTLAALLLGRALAALGTAAGAMWLFNSVLTYYRPYLWPTDTRTGPHAFDLPDGVWLVNEGSDVHGRFAAYHPASHYWPLHLTETAIVLTVAVLAVLCSFRVLKGRLTSPA